MTKMSYILLEDKKGIKVKMNWFAIQSCQNVPNIKVMNQHGRFISHLNPTKIILQTAPVLAEGMSILILLLICSPYLRNALPLSFSVPILHATHLANSSSGFLLIMVTSLFLNHSRPQRYLSSFIYIIYNLQIIYT